MAKIRCEFCGGNKKFDPASGRLKCEHCGSESYISESAQLKNITRKYSLAYSPEQKVVGSRQYLCSSCGATVSFEENDEKRRCPSCGDTSLTSQQKLIYAPDGIVPFTVSRNRAVEIFQKWIGERKFAPSDLKQMAKLGKISGLYVPAWSFNFRIVGNFMGDCTYLEKVSDDYSVTRHQYVTEAVDKAYTSVLMSANKRFSNYSLNEVAPYDILKARPYSSEYLFGFSALDSDNNIHKVYNEIIDDKKDMIESSIRSELKRKYDSIEKLNENLMVRDSSFSYVYLPIWANHYTYKGKKYHCYINGQNGKPIGKSPKSFWKILAVVLGVGAAVVIPLVLLLSKFL